MQIQLTSVQFCVVNKKCHCLRSAFVRYSVGRSDGRLMEINRKLLKTKKNIEIDNESMETNRKPRENQWKITDFDYILNGFRLDCASENLIEFHAKTN